MPHRWTVHVAVVLLAVGLLAGPALAQPDAGIDRCINADSGPGDDGPPGFVGGLLPDFLGSLVGTLPVPNFVKSFFGAPTC